MATQNLTEAEYLAHLEHERRMFAWVLRTYGSLSVERAHDLALASYPYEEPSDLRGLVFHDEAWHWAMLHIHGAAYWQSHPELEQPSKDLP